VVTLIKDKRFIEYNVESENINMPDKKRPLSESPQRGQFLLIENIQYFVTNLVAC
jgi:hypothetical protein